MAGEHVPAQARGLVGQAQGGRGGLDDLRAARVDRPVRDGLPGGSIAGRKEGPELIIAVDYVTPAYQDSRIGRWVFGEGREMFTRVGISRLVTTATTSSHRNYLQQMGFRPDGTNWVKDLTEPVE